MHRYGTGLPDYRQLADYQPPTVTRLHAGDGRLLAEFAHEKRVFVPVEAIPKRVLQAFLAAEDKNFYSHPGIDLSSVVRAAITNLSRLMADRRPMGASTITQQVAKNFLLSNEVTFERKIKEALLAFRMEQAFTKDQILELYLNQIYLGIGSYGVAAAAINYFDKSLDELTTGEAAFLAGLPKAPSWYHPERRAEAARARRDWVIGRMLDVGFIDRAEAERAIAEPLVMRQRAPTDMVSADYFVEEVRRELVEQHGEPFLYQGGLSIRTTISPTFQAIADTALRDGLIDYDRRHGWRGPVAHTALHEDPAWPAHLTEMDHTAGLDSWQLALVMAVDAQGATIGLADGSTAPLPLAELSWARQGRHRRQPGSADRAARSGSRRRRRDLGGEGRRHGGDRGRGCERSTLCPAPGAGNRRRDRRAQSAHRPRARGSRRFQLPPQRVQPRHAGAAAAGLRVQTLRLPGRAGGRLHPVEHRARCADRDRSGPRAGQVEAGELLETILRAEHAAPRHREVAQRDDRPPCPGDRHGPDQGNGRRGSAWSGAWATISPRLWARTRSPCSS